MSITEKLTGLISEITQLERDNTTLNEQLLNLEKEKEGGYKKFDTDTHILVERKFLQDIADTADEVGSSADSAREDIESAESCAGDAAYSARNATDSAEDIQRDIEQILEGGSE